MRYGLEKVMLNSKNVSRCLEYLNESFSNLFPFNQLKPLSSDTFDIYRHSKLLLIQTMFSVVFGSGLNEFVNEEPRLDLAASFGKKLAANYNPRSDQYHTQLVAHKFHDAFVDYESFSPIKFLALVLPELELVWRILDSSKRLISASIYPFRYLADPMDFFIVTFVQKYLFLYSNAANAQAVNSCGTLLPRPSYSSQSLTTSTTRFGYLNSFLFLTFNPINKYHQNEAVVYRKVTGILKDPINK